MKLKILFIMTAIASTLTSCADTGGKLLQPVEFFETLEADKNLVLVDVRTPGEFAQGHIPGAVNADWNNDNFLNLLKQNVGEATSVAIYCRSGHRSGEAAEKLTEAGYQVVDLEGGVLAWEDSRLPLTTGNEDIYLTPGEKRVTIEPLIHASLRINFDGKEIEIDPVGKMGDRETDYSKFPKADLILVTHEHYDHLDPEAIKTLSKADTLVIANPNSRNILGYGEAMKNGDKLRVADDIEIEAVPAYNVSPDRLQFHPKGRDNGYVLTLDGLRIYIAGDTEVIPEMKDLGDIDIAFLPCNLPYTMTPEQLIEAAEIIRPKVVYPYHYGTTDLSSVAPALEPRGIYVRVCPFDPGAEP